MNIEALSALGLTLASCALGIMNYLKHAHLERDLKRNPIRVTFEIRFAGEDLQPEIKVLKAERG